MNRTDPACLPWADDTIPLMLAPMQGVTNRALRTLFVDWVQPDTVFTEFVRVNRNTRRRLSKSDQLEVSSEQNGTPLIVQLIGHDEEALVAAALAAGDAGVVHLNLNMGCPFGRMSSGLTGGGMLKAPERLPGILESLRRAFPGTFSVKMRAGYDDPDQVLDLLPLLCGSGIDFLILHPRTVVQKYSGTADHAVTARVVEKASVPVIANGDICTASSGHLILEQTGAAGLMLGRGAIADPMIFKRLRGEASLDPSPGQRAAEVHFYLSRLLDGYEELFCGERQVLSKVKEVLAFIADPHLLPVVKKLRRSKSFDAFREGLHELA
ncbi:MAG: tRNA-dihydrouridine synthase family protein [Desulfuromonadales bacterium]